jgi:hypothetical protein
MLKHRSFKLGLTILLSLVLTNVFSPHKLVSASANVDYQFEPGPNYTQSDIKAVFKVFSGAPQIQIEWLMPDGGGAYCHPVGGSGCVTTIQYSNNGYPIAASGEFYIAGQGRPAGVYTAIATYCASFIYGTTICSRRGEWVRANFTIDAYAISGNVGVGNAILNYIDGAAKKVTADATGKYTIMIPAGWSGVVTPFKSGYDFNPASRAYTSVNAMLTDQDYAAAKGRRLYLPLLAK